MGHHINEMNFFIVLQVDLLEEEVSVIVETVLYLLSVLVIQLDCVPQE